MEARAPEARIIIGSKVYINNNAVIIADKSSITIGDNSLIGPIFSVLTAIPLNPAKRLSTDYTCKPVTIGKNIFMGEGVKILQSSRINEMATLALERH